MDAGQGDTMVAPCLFFIPKTKERVGHSVDVNKDGGHGVTAESIMQSG
jgi:hypothetical protein